MNSKSSVTAQVTKPHRSNNTLLAIAAFAVLTIPVLLQSVFGVGFSSVLSNSMQPGFSAGDLLITHQVQASGLKVGDIVVLRSATTYEAYSHRITAIKNTAGELSLSTKGDANPVADTEMAKVNSLALLPKAVGHIPMAGRPILYLTQYGGGLVAGFLLILALGLGLLHWLGRKTESEKSTADETAIASEVIPPSDEVLSHQDHIASTLNN
jgi:signal peptidase